VLNTPRTIFLQANKIKQYENNLKHALLYYLAYQAFAAITILPLLIVLKTQKAH